MKTTKTALLAVALTTALTVTAGTTADASPVVRATATATATSARATTPHVAAVPISFTVRNVNRSKVACASDGRTYTIRGHLVGPAAELGERTLPLATLYLHGLSFGQFFWRFKGAPGYDYSANQAKAGQVSVVIDRLGYSSSDKPNGFGVCVGSRADMAHQMVTQLRAGSYHLGSGARAPRADSVVLAGHSFGGQIAQVEAYSFGDIDGLIVLGYSDPIQSTTLKKAAAYTAGVCAQGGKPRSQGQPGYSPFGPPSGAAATLFHSATPAVEKQGLALLTVDPCGDTGSFAAATKVDQANVAKVKVPVLIVEGGADKLFPPPAASDQAALFTGSSGVTFTTLPGTAHAFTFERTHLRLVQVVKNWLNLNVKAS